MLTILLVLAFVWGVLEATVFFIIPDAIITLIGLRGYKAGLYASLWALVGALVGGSVMYFLGVFAFDWVHNLVLHVPAIRLEMMEDVRVSLMDDGLLAMVLGPTKGIPYKIYAMYAASVDIDFFTFFLASIPARFIRFFLTGMLGAFLSQTVFHRLGMRVKIGIWLIVWIIVYVIYFTIHPL